MFSPHFCDALLRLHGNDTVWERIHLMLSHTELANTSKQLWVSWLCQFLFIVTACDKCQVYCQPQGKHTKSLKASVEPRVLCCISQSFKQKKSGCVSDANHINHTNSTLKCNQLNFFKGRKSRLDDMSASWQYYCTAVERFLCPGQGGSHLDEVWP